MKGLRTLFPKHQYSSTSAKVTRLKAKETHPKIGLVLYCQPVTFASRALTPAEQKSSQVEKELLAQVFGMEHNDHYKSS